MMIYSVQTQPQHIRRPLATADKDTAIQTALALGDGAAVYAYGRTITELIGKVEGGEWHQFTATT